ncbi:MAG: serine/threonine protein kinase [Deltaproteobacteria bacterium]|nr:serine/threonine protein kinase [Deltaproteobacteria bacterium]
MTSAKLQPISEAAKLERFQVGRYEVLALLATGGMAEVFLAKLIGARGFERAVVLKRVLPHLARQSHFRTMFLDEARVVAAIAHPNVVQVHELGEEGDDLFLVMEYVAGESLATVLKRVAGDGERLPAHVAAFIVAEAAAGLHAAHQLVGDDGMPLDVVHRDVSPHNIMVTYDGQVKVLDFGIAKSENASHNTESGVMKGKFAYMAPEQYQRDPVDRRTDVFALGTVLWESLVSRRLFARRNDVETLRAICEDSIPQPSEVGGEFPESLEAACMKALARPKDERFQTAEELQRALEASLREVAPDKFPQDDLREIMKRYFSSRQEEKREMLKKVRSGRDLTHVPNPDPATGPTVAAKGLRGKKGQSRWIPWISAGALLLSVIVGAVAALYSGDDEPPEAESVATPPAEPVRVHIRSRPSGAEVTFGGRVLGTTPVQTELPHSEEPMMVRFHLPGYAELEERVVPDSDVRLHVVLIPEQAEPTPMDAVPTTMEEPPAETAEMATEEPDTSRSRRRRRRRSPTMEQQDPEYFRFD